MEHELPLHYSVLIRTSISGKWVVNKYLSTVPYQPSYCLPSWLPVKNRINIKMLLTVYEALHGLAPNRITEPLFPPIICSSATFHFVHFHKHREDLRSSVYIHPFLQKPMGAAMSNNYFCSRFSVSGCLASAWLTAGAKLAQNNSRKLKDFSETSCVEHEQLRWTCPCPAPYALHAMPRKVEWRLAWLATLRLKYPPKRVFVCSFHFVDKKPTKLHPDPELYLGYDRPPLKKRRKLVHATSSTTRPRSGSGSSRDSKL